MIRHHCALARRLGSRLAAEAGVRVLNSVQLNQLIVSFGNGTNEQRDALTRATIARLQADNICLAGGTEWRGQWVLRLSVIFGLLTEPDVDRLAAAIFTAWRYVQRQPEMARAAAPVSSHQRRTEGRS
jgi:glutamate/tyrosine decarboxylase-like PLP-dependent enzyme